MSTNDYLIAPSILSADFARLGEDVEKVLDAGADWVHFDVMDNHFVPNLSIGPMVCKALRDYGISAPIDVHLMVEPVDELVSQFADVGASLISFHPEASTHIDRTIGLIREKGCQAGLVLNPATSVEQLQWVLDDLDMVLLMSVNPGFGGQSYIPQVTRKIETLAETLVRRGLDIIIQVDGGVNTETIAGAASAGATVFVAGTAVFGEPDYAQAIARLRDAAGK